MITFVTGKPGDGKSMYGMKIIAQSIMSSNRTIITNVPIKIPELRAYLISKGWKPRVDGDLDVRLKLLAHEDVFEFYRHRSAGYVLPPSPDWIASREADGEKKKKITRFEFIKRMSQQLLDMRKASLRFCGPCEYHIDEAHDYFSAREWADTGRGVLWYASKHRHLHDEIVLYTQVMGNVESQLRGLASESIRVKNQMRMSWGPFQKAPVFRVYFYYGASDKLESGTPYATSVMQLDVKGLASTYNSAGALSVHKTPEVIKNRAPLPYWTLPIAACIMVGVVAAAFAWLPTALGGRAGKMISQASLERVGQAAGVSLRSNGPLASDVVESRGGASQVPDGAPVRIPISDIQGTAIIDKDLRVCVSRLGWLRVRALVGSDLLLENGDYVSKSILTVIPRKPVEPPVAAVAAPDYRSSLIGGI